MINRVVLVGPSRAGSRTPVHAERCGRHHLYPGGESAVHQSTGEREADFINIVTWRQQAETCANYLKRDAGLGVDGRLQIRSYENSEGRRIKVAEVVADTVRVLEPAGARSRRPAEGDPFGRSRNEMDDPFADDGKPI